jgi:hypothetical protein
MTACRRFAFKYRSATKNSKRISCHHYTFARTGGCPYLDPIASWEAVITYAAMVGWLANDCSR